MDPTCPVCWTPLVYRRIIYPRVHVRSHGCFFKTLADAHALPLMDHNDPRWPRELYQSLQIRRWTKYQPPCLPRPLSAAGFVAYTPSGPVFSGCLCWLVQHVNWEQQDGGRGRRRGPVRRHQQVPHPIRLRVHVQGAVRATQTAVFAPGDL